MKERFKLAILAMILLGALGMAPMAMAGTIDKFDQVKADDWGWEGGGIIYLSIRDSHKVSKPGPYLTFCIEREVNIYPNTWYTVADISQSLGSGGTLSQYVDYLFYMFATGKQGYSGLSQAEQNALQHVMWFFQDNQGYDPGWVPAVGTYERAFYDDAMAHASQRSAWGTKVLNLVDAAGKPVQNQLYHDVPEPSCLLLLGLGLGSIGVVTRRK